MALAQLPAHPSLRVLSYFSSGLSPAVLTVPSVWNAFPGIFMFNSKFVHLLAQISIFELVQWPPY